MEVSGASECCNESTVSSLEYLKEVAGPRVVPVELGGKYTSDKWSQRLMPVASFIDEYIVSPEILYLILMDKGTFADLLCNLV